MVIPGNVPCSRHCSVLLELILQGENLDSCLWWLDPVMVMHERCSLPEGVAVEELHRPCVVIELVGADMVYVIAC